MGTPEFAAVSLKKLYENGYEVACVITRTDKPRSRGMKVTASPVKIAAQEHGTPVFQPETPNSTEALDLIRNLGCDLIALVAYGKILPHAMLAIPPLGCVNIHASLLPKYRGAAPVQWSVLQGERETGVTSILMADKIDTGDILLTKHTPIGDDETAAELYDRLSYLGADLLVETLEAIASGTAVRIPQSRAEVTHAPALHREMSPIDWAETAQNIKNKVRGLTPWPIATAVIGGAILKIFEVEARLCKTGKQPGEIVAAGGEGIEIACADGSVVIKKLQPPGGRRMAAAEYLRGHPLVNENH
ncbi:MAG: methionyl-tRNA formyltransferase [Oscillospiraceae bacterium]|nr:methionyl-tRNA formyltransferase [Oscillospiraceae bacterium]